MEYSEGQCGWMEVPTIIAIGSLDMLTVVIEDGWEEAVLVINAIMHSVDVPTVAILGYVEALSTFIVRD